MAPSTVTDHRGKDIKKVLSAGGLAVIGTEKIPRYGLGLSGVILEAPHECG